MEGVIVFPFVGLAIFALLYVYCIISRESKGSTTSRPPASHSSQATPAAAAIVPTISLNVMSMDSPPAYEDIFPNGMSPSPPAESQV